MTDSPLNTHRASAPDIIRCALITVSDTRTPDTDRGGQKLLDHLDADGYRIVARDIIPDEPEAMRSLLTHLTDQPIADAVLLTGGTGIGRRDQTFETVSSLLDKVLPGYGELFRMLSYQEIGPAAMLSRAIGGVRRQSVVLTMPGSPAAVDLAMTKIILPELGHLVQQAKR